MLIFIVSAVVIAVTVLIHYEALGFMSARIPGLPLPSQLKVLVGVLGALLAHIIEIGLFGLAYYWANGAAGLGVLIGNYNGSLMDSLYFSFTTYSSLGVGDIEPIGGIRFLAGLEALIGLVLIGWTASFMYLQMSRYWKKVV